MDSYLNIFLNNITPFFANIGILILLAWLISYFYKQNNHSILEIKLQDKIIIGLLFGLGTILLITTAIQLVPGIIMDTRAVPLLISGMVGGPVSGIITMIIGLITRYSYGGAGMLGGLIYIVIFSLAGILWYKLRNLNNFPTPKRLVVITIVITLLTIPVIFTLPEDKRVWALITLWPLMFIANGFGSYVIGSVVFNKIQAFNKDREQKQTIKEQKEELTLKEIQAFENAKMTALGEMLSSIAHQWRQPLNTISIAISGLYLKSKSGREVTQEDIEKNNNIIVKQTQYLSHTVETFINFARKDSEVKDIDIKEEMKQAKEIVEASLTYNFIDIIDNVDYKPTIVYATKGDLTQVFINIINNAKDVIKQREIPEGKVFLETIEDESSITFTIEDNAGGIPKEILNRVFEPYFTTKHQSVGTGLGLHICYKIITESYKGELSVKNTEQGAKFFIKIPIE